MKNQFYIFECAPKGSLIRETRFDKINVTANFFEILAVTGRQIVNDANPSTARRKGRGDSVNR